jgi:hypothetical protein
MSGLPFIEGFMPIQMLAEMGILALLFIGIFYLLEKKLAIKANKLAQAIALYIFSLLYFNFRVYPPMPFSVRAIYAVLVLLGIFMWVSSTEESWKDFRRPILAVLDGETAATRGVRAVFVVLLPFLVWLLGWNSLTFHVQEPIELRTVNPAPPASTNVHGKTYMLQSTSNPFRVDDSGHYSNVVQKQYSHGNPWDELTSSYLRYIREGGQIYFQECHFCHGANLNGRGIFSYAFRPWPTNFTDPGTIAQLQETYLFWRTAKGGLALPREGFPWLSVMPSMEQHLSTEEIWKVILFEYWHAGYYPRTWD